MLKNGEVYKGWKVTEQKEDHPVTGKWRAERFGVGMGANNAEMLQRMIDDKTRQEEIERKDRDKRFTVEPGRNIYRDGQPYITVNYVTDANSYRSISPAEADHTTRHICDLLNEDEYLRTQHDLPLSE